MITDEQRNDIEFALTGLVVDGKYAPQIFAELDENELHCELARTIYIALKRHWAKTGSSDLTPIALALPEDEKEYAYWAVYDLATQNWQAVVNAIQERNIVANAKAIATDLMTSQTAEDVLDAQARLIKATQHDIKETAVDMESAVMSFLSRMNQKTDHIKTGYSKLDKYTYIDRGDFVILAGEQSSGKTAFSISLMLNMAKAGRNCVYFSLETSTEKIFDRMITNYTHVDFQRLKQRQLFESEMNQVAEATGDLLHLPIHIVNASGRTVDWIKAEAIRLRADVIFIDYLGLINAKGKSRYEMVTNTSLALHTMAQTSGITIICLSQLKRPESGTKRKPTMHDLRESGQIEADADLIILLYNDRENDEYTVIVEKNKEGNVGYIDFHFDGEHQSFYEVDYDRQEYGTT